MDTIFCVDTALEIPLYQQLVDRIETAIKKGHLSVGQKLPTVQEISQNLSIARGTIKRAYDELEHKGLLEKIQGRGTFVSYQPMSTGSRKDHAMRVIDDMLNQLEDMGFSATEINIFLNLKLRERAEQEADVKVIVVESCQENLMRMSEQLRTIAGVDLYSYLLETIRSYPYKLGDDFDLLITTPEHAEYMQSILTGKKRIVRAVLKLEDRCAAQIIRLAEGSRLGIVGYSEEFGMQLFDSCGVCNPEINVSRPWQTSDADRLSEYLKGKDAVLVPDSFETLFGTEISRAILDFPGKRILCSYEMDRGSMLYLETKIKHLLDAKTL